MDLVPKTRINTKAKGTRNEHRSIKLLEAQGYACCRAAASLGLWDIIAARADRILFIQVKTNRRPPREEMLRLAAAVYPHTVCTKLLHIYHDGVRLPEELVIPYPTGSREPVCAPHG